MEFITSKDYLCLENFNGITFECIKGELYKCNFHNSLTDKNGQCWYNINEVDNIETYFGLMTLSNLENTGNNLKDKIENCIQLTADLHNQFSSIDNKFKHKNDMAEMTRDIHDIQNRLMAILYLNNKNGN